jgi:hypothetical protein
MYCLPKKHKKILYNIFIRPMLGVPRNKREKRGSAIARNCREEDGVEEQNSRGERFNQQLPGKSQGSQRFG